MKITVNNKKIFQDACKELEAIYGPDAEFREGQYEAIEATLTNKRTLVVQKTGWGKSLVYFISAKLINGLTIVVSPLLILMDNQKEYAEKIGLKCSALNSNVKGNDRKELLDNIEDGECDVLFITPENLFKSDVQKLLPNLNIGLFVVDECHCISDWGHDFRLDYGKLNRVISSFPENVSVLGTTATANDRVIEDLKKQFGNDVFVSRGSLTRESLHIEILRIESKAERYAWLEKNINNIPGTGIIYCTTKNDCNRLSDFLISKGIGSRPYHAGNEIKNSISETEELFRHNRIKVLVATVKMGMGYDKSDIRFVIHFQRPSSLVAYYQQIGRAGRDGKDAYCYLMTGKEDNNINQYFIDEAFPSKEQEEPIVSAVENSDDGLRYNELTRYSNISGHALNRSIMFLINQGIIYENYVNDEKGKYFRTPKPYVFQGEYYEKIKKIKRDELEAFEKYLNHKGCLSRYVVNSLNDNTAEDCGKCFNCLKSEILRGIDMPSVGEVNAVQDYLNSLYIVIEPRKKWISSLNPFDNSITITNVNEEGLVLSRYNDAGYGSMDAYDKYHADEFRDELVEKAVQVIAEKTGNDGYTAVTNIPSLRNKKVESFAKKVADKLGYQYIDALDVTGNGAQQKTMENSYHQYMNAMEKIKIKDGVQDLTGLNMVLIDDLVDSRWTLTVAGALLKQSGAGRIYPFCLADSSKGVD